MSIGIWTGCRAHGCSWVPEWLPTCKSWCDVDRLVARCGSTFGTTRISSPFLMRCGPTRDRGSTPGAMWSLVAQCDPPPGRDAGSDPHGAMWTTPVRCGPTRHGGLWTRLGNDLNWLLCEPLRTPHCAMDRSCRTSYGHPSVQTRASTTCTDTCRACAGKHAPLESSRRGGRSGILVMVAY